MSELFKTPEMVNTTTSNQFLPNFYIYERDKQPLYLVSSLGEADQVVEN